jgi:hypothetical protein
MVGEGRTSGKGPPFYSWGTRGNTAALARGRAEVLRHSHGCTADDACVVRAAVAASGQRVEAAASCTTLSLRCCLDMRQWRALHRAHAWAGAYGT